MPLMKSCYGIVSPYRISALQCSHDVNMRGTHLCTRTVLFRRRRVDQAVLIALKWNWRAIDRLALLLNLSQSRRIFSHLHVHAKSLLFLGGEVNVPNQRATSVHTIVSYDWRIDECEAVVMLCLGRGNCEHFSMPACCG